MPLLDAIPVFGPWRIRRDAEKFQAWQAFLDTQHNGAQLFQIIRIRQRARTGLKAYGQWLNTKETHALWIAGAWPPLGMYMSAHGGFDDGPHHRELVFYVHQPVYLFDPKNNAGVRRHLKRVSNSKPVTH